MINFKMLDQSVTTKMRNTVTITTNVGGGGGDLPGAH